MTFISSLNEDNLEIFISLFNEFFKSGYFLSHISKNDCSIDIIICALRCLLIGKKIVRIIE